MINDIPQYEKFSKIEPIQKGWSSDKKYYIETNDKEHFLLRISDVSKYEEKKKEFDIMKKLEKVGIKMSNPISFGVCNSGKNVYQILTWIEGNEAKEVLPLYSLKEQYLFGYKAGQMMLKMEIAENYPPSSNWQEIYSKKVFEYLKAYKICGHRLYGEEILLSFLEEHSAAIENRPMSLLHADFQTDNMIISPNNELFAIDFQGSGIVDPYYALTAVMVSAENSPSFANGQLHSYFNGDVPDEFWEISAFYMVAESINAFSVAVGLGQKEIDYSNEMSKTLLEWVDNFNNLVPSWYQKYTTE